MLRQTEMALFFQKHILYQKQLNQRFVKNLVTHEGRHGPANLVIVFTEHVQSDGTHENENEPYWHSYFTHCVEHHAL